MIIASFPSSGLGAVPAAKFVDKVLWYPGRNIVVGLSAIEAYQSQLKTNKLRSTGDQINKS